MKNVNDVLLENLNQIFQNELLYLVYELYVIVEIDEYIHLKKKDLNLIIVY